MKKLSIRVRERQVRVNWRLRKAQARVAANRKKRKLRRDWRNKPKVRLKTLFVPKHIALHNKYIRRKTLEFLSGLKKSVAQGSRNIRLSFAETEQLDAAGTLLMTAELNRLKDLYGEVLQFSGVPPTKTKPHQVLVQIGLASLLGMRAPDQEVEYEDVVNWRYAYGQGVHGEKYDELLGNYDGVITPALSSNLYKSLTEAMTNAHQHAYIDLRQDELVTPPADYKPWWMFSQEKDGKLTVLICDLGIGIPETLPRTKPTVRQWLTKLGRKASDSELIEQAIETARSRTKQHFRGRGLKQIVESIANTPGAKVFVFSNKGCYQMGDAVMPKRLDFKDSILGTIILWQMPLKQEASGNENH